MKKVSLKKILLLTSTIGMISSFPVLSTSCSDNTNPLIHKFEIRYSRNTTNLYSDLAGEPIIDSGYLYAFLDEKEIHPNFEIINADEEGYVELIKQPSETNPSIFYDHFRITPYPHEKNNFKFTVKATLPWDESEPQYLDFTITYSEFFPKSLLEINSETGMLTGFSDEYYKNPTAFGSYDGILIPKEVTSIKMDSFADALPSNIKIIKFEDGSQLRQVGVRAFKNNSGLEQIDLSNTVVTDIDQNAFIGCTSLKLISFPSTLSTISNYAFSGCTSIENLDFSSTNLLTCGSAVFQGCKALKQIKFPNQFSSFGDTCFNQCTALTTIDLSNTNITSLSKNLFAGDSALCEIKVNQSKVLQIDDGAYNGTGISSFTCWPGLNFGSNVFLGCVKLSSFSFKNYTGSSIPAGIFSGCTSLETVKDISTSIKTVSENAFKSCVKLNFSGLPFSNFTAIKANAFSGVLTITSLTVPSSMQIYQFAFAGCSNLSSITWNNTSGQKPANAFGLNCFTNVAEAGFVYSTFDQSGLLSHLREKCGLTTDWK